MSVGTPVPTQPDQPRSAVTGAVASLRWARASDDRQHFCANLDHAASDYIFMESKFEKRRADADDIKPVEKVACGVCWPKASNPTAVS